MTPTPPVIPDSSTPIDLDDAESDIRDSMYADDRQTRRQLDAGSKALSALLKEISELREARRSQQSTWVKCSERMPEDTERVWFFANERVLKGEFQGDKFYTSAGFGWNGPEVTHWVHRPLEPARPSPPEAP